MFNLLTTEEDPEENGRPTLRLSFFGHAVLTGTLFLTAGVTFAINMQITREAIHRWDLCVHSSGPNSLPSSIEDGNLDWKQEQQALNQALNSLSAASQPQRARLLEQHHEIRGVMNSHCLMSHSFEIQFSAFTFVGTAAAILLTICLASVAPDGLKTKNRSLLNAMMTSSLILGICVIYPQTFAQSSNAATAKNVYVQASNLLRMVNSALANQQIASDPKNPSAFTALTSSQAVATLIRMNDEALIQLTATRVAINNDFASRTFSQVDPSGPSGSGSAATPAAPAPATGATPAATTGSAAP